MSKITDEMVETAARALCKAWGYCWDGDPDDYQTAPEGGRGWDYDERPSKALYREAARRALEAVAPMIRNAALDEASAICFAHAECTRAFKRPSNYIKGEAYAANVLALRILALKGGV